MTKHAFKYYHYLYKKDGTLIRVQSNRTPHEHKPKSYTYPFLYFDTDSKRFVMAVIPEILYGTLVKECEYLGCVKVEE